MQNGDAMKKIKNACTINERFERPRQLLKGIPDLSKTTMKI
jgi:hypothetical protein